MELNFAIQMLLSLHLILIISSFLDYKYKMPETPNIARGTTDPGY